jgi:muconolactone delta-isomerase
VEYLVTMTTHVPDGTPDAEVQDVRDREAANSRRLAARKQLLRLWRPPLRPGEWRSLGLFAAGDGDQLEEVLASMPLRVWRSDEVTPLAPHPNDPAGHPETGSPGPASGASEFLTEFTVTVPAGTPEEAVEAALAHEADQAREQAGQGHLRRLWALPGPGRALGLWQARDGAEIQEIVASLPLSLLTWMDTQTTPLTPHPSDPAGAGS